jgi:ribosome-associated protein
MGSAREAAERGTPPSGYASIRAHPARLLNVVLDTLDAAKAEDVVCIDLKGKTSIGDHMVLASGRSQRHVGAVADHIVRKLKDEGFGRACVEGQPQCDWVLIDAGDVIVHVFRPEVREFYNLEKMWSADRPMERLVI